MLLAPISACTAFSAETHTPLSPDPEKSLTGDSAPPEADKSEQAFSFWPWKNGEAAKPPPVQPYKIPTLSGDNLNFKDKPAALVKAPAIDAEAVYDYVLACYPEKSKWDLDVNLRAQLANSTGDIFGTNSSSTELGDSYVAIVANMPLYSVPELNREREREHARRQEVATTVADFIAALASRNHAVRELALYRSLEARAALRVQQGIVDSSEQVKYLEKVAGSQNHGNPPQTGRDV